MSTLPVILWITCRETVTVAVLFIQPTLVTIPVSAMGGMVARDELVNKLGRSRDFTLEA